MGDDEITATKKTKVLQTMLANPTTLILGAGASHHLGYPTGAELRDWIIEGRGIDLLALQSSKNAAEELGDLFQRSLVGSIDAFLAESENKRFAKIGIECIAAALLPCESSQKAESPGWYQSLFNAIRGRKSEDRRHRLKVVTFNYDLSLEHVLFHAFKATYKLDDNAALEMLNESIEFIHVYGQLGQISELAPNGGRSFGVAEDWVLEMASQGIKIIGRDPDAPEFKAAQEAIKEAEFLAILGFGYDQTNVANLKIKELAGDKYAFSTGFQMGYGMRGWVREMGLPQISIGAFNHNVGTFLHHSGFLQWANTPGATSKNMRQAITSYMANHHSLLPE